MPIDADSIGISYRIDLTKLEASIKAAEAKLTEFNNRISNLGQRVASKMNTAATSVRGMSAASGSASEQLKQMGISATTTAAEIKAMNLSAIETAAVLKLTRDRMRELTNQTAKTGTSTQATAKEFKTLQQRMPPLQDEANKGVKAFGDYRRAMDRWGQGFKYMMLSQAAWIASGAILFGTLSAVGSAVKDFVDFHQDMRDAAAIVQATTTGYEKMEKAAVKAFLNSTMSLKDTTSALKILGQTGMEAADAAIALETVYKITTATGGDTTTVVKFLTTAINVWKLSAEEAAAVGNVLGAALNYSKLEVEDMGTTFNYVASLAKSLKLSIVDLASIMAVMSNAGIKASTIGTGLRGVFTKLLAPTNKLEKQLKTVGLTIADVSLETNNFFDVLKRLETAGFDIGNIFRGMTRREAASLNVMLEQGVERFNLMREALKDTTAVEVMFERSMKGMKNQIILAGHAMQQYMIDRLNNLRPIITGTAMFVRELITTMGQLHAVYLTVGLALLAHTAKLFMVSNATSALIKITYAWGVALNFIRAHPVFAWLTALTVGLTLAKMAFDALTTSVIEQRSALNKRIDDMRKLQILMLDSNRTEEEKLKIMDEYSKDYPELLDLMKSHKIRIEDIIDATKKLIAVDKERQRDLDLGALAQMEGDRKRLESLKKVSEASKKTGFKEMIMTEAGPIELDLDRIIENSDKQIDELDKKITRLKIKLGLIFVGIIPSGKDISGTMWTDELQKEFEKLSESAASERVKAKIELDKGLEQFKSNAYTKTETETKFLEARFLLHQAYDKKIAEIDEKFMKKLKELADEKRRELQKEDDAISRFETQQRNRKEKETERREKELERSTDFQRKWVTKISKFNEDLTEDNIKLIKDEYTKRQFYLEKEILERRRKYQELLAEAEDYFTDLAKLAIDNPLLIPELDRVAKLIENIKSMQGVLSGIEGKERGALAKETPWNFSAGMEEGLREARTEISNEYEIWRNASKNTALAMRDSFSDLFFDAMRGELKTLGDYWKAFSNAVKRQIADMAASWLTSGLLKLGGNLLLKGFIGATNIGGGLGGTALAEHDGGLIRKMHGGGPAIKSDETLRVLKENEFVIKDSSARSLGLNALNFMNKTGRTPSAGPNVTSVHNSYTIVAMDSESMDQALRRGGAKAIQDISIGSYAYERERRNPVFGMGR